MLTGGSVYGGAWVITGLGVATHNLPMVYLGNRESAFFVDFDQLKLKIFKFPYLVENVLLDVSVKIHNNIY